jgi:hypothetical protein
MNSGEGRYMFSKNCGTHRVDHLEKDQDFHNYTVLSDKNAMQ